jgi:hypothetical protein
MVMLAISQYYHMERDIVSGLVILASLVLLRSMFARRRRLSVVSHPVYRDIEDDDRLEDVDIVILDPDADLGPASSSRH